MPRPGTITSRQHEHLVVNNMPWLNEALGQGFVRGGVYLVSGEPGVGKSTLVQQALGGLAQQGVKTLYLTSEQSLGDLNASLQRLFAFRSGRLPNGVSENFHIEDHVRDVEELPRFLTRHVLPQGQEYSGVKVIAFDSIQGKGLSGTATKKFNALYEFADIAKANGLVTILLGHINKAGQIAGPKTLEHNVDCTLYMRRAFRMRPLFVTKNRFGPATLEPIPLFMDNDGRLNKSPQANATCASVLGYAGTSSEYAEVQASVSLAKFGVDAQLNAPSLPRQKMRQIIKVLGGLKNVDLSELSYEVNCYVPGRRTYSEDLDLPLAVSLLSSYLQQPVPPATLFIGELDLTQRIRPPRPSCLENLAKLLLSEPIDRVYISDKAERELLDTRPTPDGDAIGETSIMVHGVKDLESLLRELWPTLFAAPG